jgi:hypothetical protein
MNLVQKDLQSLLQGHPAGVRLVLKFDQTENLYNVFFGMLNVDGEQDGEAQRLYTQRKAPKTFTDLNRAVRWGREQGFTDVIFHHRWK